MSNYSQDLNNAISREVQIAALPTNCCRITSTTDQPADEFEHSRHDFAAVQSAVSGLASAAGSMLTATVSDPSVASAMLTSTATAGSYTLQVTNLGSYSDALSNNGLTKVTDPSSQNISSSSSYTLRLPTAAVHPYRPPSLSRAAI